MGFIFFFFCFLFSFWYSLSIACVWLDKRPFKMTSCGLEETWNKQSMGLACTSVPGVGISFSFLSFIWGGLLSPGWEGALFPFVSYWHIGWGSQSPGWGSSCASPSDVFRRELLGGCALCWHFCLTDSQHHSSSHDGWQPWPDAAWVLLARSCPLIWNLSWDYVNSETNSME